MWNRRLPLMLLAVGIVLLTGWQRSRPDRDLAADRLEMESLMPVVNKDIELFGRESAVEDCRFRSMGPILPLLRSRPRTWDVTILGRDAKGEGAFYTLEYEWSGNAWRRARSFPGFPEDRPRSQSAT